MEQGKRRKIGLIAMVAIVALLSTGAIGFIAVQNLDPAPVITGTISVSAYEVNLEQSKTWSWNIGDPVDPAFDTATVKGTMAFSVVMTGDPVDFVKLTINGGTFGTFYFTEGAVGWSLAFDTTTLADGEYTFALSYGFLDATGGSTEIAMSTFGFSINDDEVW